MTGPLARAEPPAEVDAIALAQALIRCPSVTPVDAGTLDVLGAALEPLGFACHRLRFEADGTAPVDNLYARIGEGAPHFCFAGHTDVVPAGPLEAWSRDPFAGTLKDDRLWGRGAADMKGAVACFASACARFLKERHGSPPGSISLLITGDEEGPAINGTRKVLAWLADRGERPDACLVGEPTSARILGDTLKIGRRGSLNAVITASGVQGHSAYPELADNPIPPLVRLLATLDATSLDHGSTHFQPSKLVITSVDVGNRATNVIPAAARAMLNIRFNDMHSAASLERWLDRQIRAAGDRFTLACECSGESFLCPAGPFSALVEAAIARVTGRRPALSTSGGTSDARFIKDVCPVLEFGPVGESAHKVDENIALADLAALTSIYHAVLTDFFGAEA